MLPSSIEVTSYRWHRPSIWAENQFKHGFPSGRLAVAAAVGGACFRFDKSLRCGDRDGSKFAGVAFEITTANPQPSFRRKIDRNVAAATR